MRPVAEEKRPAQRGPVKIKDQSRAFEIQRQFQERITLYRQHGHDRERAMRFICKLGAPFNPPALEIGSGKGITALELARWFPGIISLDISMEELAFAGLNLAAFEMEDQVSLVQADAAHLPFDDRSFRTIFMVNALHHLPEPGAIFEEVVRVLAPGGRFILADFTTEGFQIINRVHGLEEREHNRFSHSMDEAVARFNAMGLCLISRAEAHQEEAVVLKAAPYTP